MSPLRGLRVLIVEDNFMAADSLRALITAHGARVTAMVPTVEDAVAALEAEPIDLAILDIRLRAGKVVSLADRLLADRIPFFFLTGYGDSGSLPEHLRQLPLLNKPVDVDRLLATVAVVFDKS